MKNKQKKNLLVTLADKNYINQTKQLFSSVYWNAGWKGDYLLLAHEIPEKDLKWFRNKGILIKKVKSITNKEIKSTWPITVFSKFYLFTKYFKQWKNIIFLDSDIIVRASLQELTNVQELWAVKNNDRLLKLFIRPILARLRKIDTKIYKQLKKDYNLNAHGFNSGVLAFNTKVIKENSFKKLMRLFEKYIQINESDETSINLLFYKKWNKLNKLYNLHPYPTIPLYKIKPNKLQGIILHFTKNKPWNPKSRFYNEWKDNLNNAELINLKKPQNVKIWTKLEIRKYSDFLEKRRKRYFYKKTKLKIYQLTDEAIGLIGLLIKNIRPRIYFGLKKRLKKD